MIVCGTLPYARAGHRVRVLLFNRGEKRGVAEVTRVLQVRLDGAGAVRKNEIVLFSVPRPIRTMHKSEGWTPESIATELAPAFASSFHKLERTGEIFPYEPI